MDRIGLPRSIAISLANQAGVILKQGDTAKALTLAEESMNIANEHGLTHIAVEIEKLLNEIRSQIP
ncbi:hypothetical protein KKB99_07625 [bacterium]|nr:hypothetical protein [bacterium]MBU1025861.1 hypothetical protein [bacterium]